MVNKKLPVPIMRLGEIYRNHQGLEAKPKTKRFNLNEVRTNATGNCYRISPPETCICAGEVIQHERFRYVLLESSYQGSCRRTLTHGRWECLLTVHLTVYPNSSFSSNKQGVLFFKQKEVVDGKILIGMIHKMLVYIICGLPR